VLRPREPSITPTKARRKTSMGKRRVQKARSARSDPPIWPARRAAVVIVFVKLFRKVRVAGLFSSVVVDALA
jgi:hypothetical protein